MKQRITASDLFTNILIVLIAAVIIVPGAIYTVCEWVYILYFQKGETRT
jgi:hypothetical protein